MTLSLYLTQMSQANGPLMKRNTLLRICSSDSLAAASLLTELAKSESNSTMYGYILSLKEAGLSVGGMDPIKWAANNNYKASAIIAYACQSLFFKQIDGKHPIIWGCNNGIPAAEILTEIKIISSYNKAVFVLAQEDVKIGSLHPAEYALRKNSLDDNLLHKMIEAGFKIKGKHPLTWAVEQGYDIESLVVRIIKDHHNKKDDSMLKVDGKPILSWVYEQDKKSAAKAAKEYNNDSEAYRAVSSITDGRKKIAKFYELRKKEYDSRKHPELYTMDQALNSRAVSFEKILNSLLLKKVEIEGQNPVTWARKHHIPIEKVVESQFHGANSAELLGAFIDAGEFYVSIADRKRGQKRNDPEAWAQSVKYHMDALEFNLLDPYNANLEEHLIGLAKANTKIGVNKEHPFVWAAKQDINWLSTNWHNADSHMPLEAMLNKMKEGKASILPTLVALEEAGIKVNGEHPLVWAANQGMKRESLRKGLAELEKKGIDTIGIVKGLKVETLDPKRIKTKSLEPETASESGELSSRRVAQDSAKIPESLKPETASESGELSSRRVAQDSAKIPESLKPETPVRKLVMLSSRRVTPVSPKIPLHAHKKSHVERLAEESRATNSSSKERK